jgi:carbamoyl-phosphate synthase small subunit
MSRALLVLEDGTTYSGTAFGATGEAVGLLSVWTDLVGYQEALTDPAQEGRIVLFSVPELGNVGVNPADDRSDRIQAVGVVAKHVALAPSSHRATGDLPSWLAAGGVPGIQGLDTRALVRHLRDRGPLVGALSTREGAEPEALLAAARAHGRAGGEG